MMRAAVITFPGSNCDRDMAVAIAKISGTPPLRVWHGDAALPDGLDFIALPFPAIHRQPNRGEAA